jgi:two-component system, sensor histidine kinase LadS
MRIGNSLAKLISRMRPSLRCPSNCCLSAAVLWALCSALAWHGAAAASVQDPSALPSIVLDAQGKPSSVAAQAAWWLDADGLASINDITATTTQAQFAQSSGETMYRLRSQQRLWVRLELDRPADATNGWKIWMPVPLIDVVTLYEQRDGLLGAWTASRAGDKIAVSQWPEYGRYPRFHLNLPAGKTVVYLQIQGSTPVTVPLLLATESEAQQVDHLAYLGLGVVTGSLLLLVALCFVMSYTYRDRLYLIYGFYAMLMILAVGAYTGLAAQIVWNNSPVWADAAQGALALFTSGAALFFIDTVLAVKRYAPRWATALRVLGALGPVLALVYVGLERYLGVSILSVYIVCVCYVGIHASVKAWRRGDVVARWVFFAYLPLAASVIMAIVRAMGWVPISWIVQYGVVAAMFLEVPLLMVALNIRSRERHAAQTRSESTVTQDALTGLLTEHLFQDRLHQTVRRARRSGEHAAVILVSLVNHASIVADHGPRVAEHSLLRSVIKLRRVLRDVDTAARVGQAQFGLILEGAQTRDQVTQVAARLIALGLMPLKGLVPEVTLQFQFSAVLLHEYADEADALQDKLQYVLSHMSPRTRRPIRFLSPNPSLAPASSLRSESARDSVIGPDAPTELDSVLPGGAGSS